LLAGVSPLVGLLAVLVGITTTVILFCSHWHQIQGDIRAGKMSPLVRLGTENACQVGSCTVDSTLQWDTGMNELVVQLQHVS
jgi:1,4-dihydroxy-2-naphthoate octaprenyltransferase